MTDNKTYRDDDLEMMRLQDDDSGPKISPRSTARAAISIDDALERELRDPVANDLLPPRSGMHYGRTGVSRPPPPPVSAGYSRRAESVERVERIERQARGSAMPERSSPLGKWMLAAAGAVAIAGCAVLATWYVMSSRLPSDPATVAKPADEPIKNVFWQQAQKAGAMTCSKAVSEMGNVVTQGSTFALQSTFAKEDADRHALQMIVGQVYGQQDGKTPAANLTQAASLVFASPTNDQCEGNAVRIVPVAQSCAQVSQSRAVQGALKPQDLSGVSVHEFPTNGTRVMLVPAPNDSCIIVSVIRSAS